MPSCLAWLPLRLDGFQLGTLRKSTWGWKTGKQEPNDRTQLKFGGSNVEKRHCKKHLFSLVLSFYHRGKTSFHPSTGHEVNQITPHPTLQSHGQEAPPSAKYSSPSRMPLKHGGSGAVGVGFSSSCQGSVEVSRWSIPGTRALPPISLRAATSFLAGNRRGPRPKESPNTPSCGPIVEVDQAIRIATLFENLQFLFEKTHGATQIHDGATQIHGRV